MDSDSSAIMTACQRESESSISRKEKKGDKMQSDIKYTYSIKLLGDSKPEPISIGTLYNFQSFFKAIVIDRIRRLRVREQHNRSYQ